MDRSALQAELEQLRAVRLQILSGKQLEEVRVNTGGGGAMRNLRFAETNLDKLESRIRSLESQLGASGRRRAVGVHW